MEKPSSSEITALEVTAPSQIVTLTREACHLTQVAVAEATNSLAKGSRESFQAVKEAEEKGKGRR